MLISKRYSKKNITEAATCWNKKFLHILDRHAPLRNVKIKKTSKPWFNGKKPW